MATQHSCLQVAFRKVLLATDFSAASEIPLILLKALGRRYGSKIFVGHVFEISPAYQASLEPLAADLPFRREAAQRQMRNFVQAHDFGELTVETLAEEGEVWPALSRMIAEHDVDLVIAGTRGRRGFKHIVVGSTAEQIVRCASCPVLTVGPCAAKAFSGEFNHILFATNFAPVSEQALPYALAIASEFDARLTLLHIVEEPRYQIALPYPQADVEIAKQRLHEVLPDGTGVGKKPELLVAVGLPGDLIPQAASERSADLIVMGAHRSSAPRITGHAPWRIIHQVLGAATCPVLTVAS